MTYGPDPWSILASDSSRFSQLLVLYELVNRSLQVLPTCGIGRTTVADHDFNDVNYKKLHAGVSHHYLVSFSSSKI